MAQLNQLVAVIEPLKKRTAADLNKIDNGLSKADLFHGITKTYEPKDDEGERLPGEDKAVQRTVPGDLKMVSDLLTRLFDAVYTRDVANTVARADVVVDGETVLTDVPVPFLLFLSKQVADLRIRVERLQVHALDTKWTYDEGTELWRGAPVDSVRSKRVRKPFVLYEATKEHPAQVQVAEEDVALGTWTTTRLTGAVTPVRKRQLLTRVDKLADALRSAIEKANQFEFTQAHIGEGLFDWLLAE